MSDRTIGLLTDFGLQDTYVGIMKCIIDDLAPEATVIDLCHEVAAQNILSGAYLASTVIPHLPDGGVLVGVVDPGVGSNRRAIAVDVGGRYLVGPDNGLFGMVLEHHDADTVVALENSRFFRSDVSATFHGRDIFAPVAAHIARGVSLEDLGPTVDTGDLTQLPFNDPYLGDNRVECHVIHRDRFGNLITNLSRADLEDWLEGSDPRVELDGRKVSLEKTFSNSSSGEPVAYYGSTNQLEVAVNGGDAARYFGADQGTSVLIQRD
jgi:S-adenosylmethionine hydrolase